MPSRTPTSDKDAAKARVTALDVPDDDPEATQTLAAIDTTQPLDQRGNGAPLVPVRTDEARDLADATERGVRLARNAEHQRFAAQFAVEAAQVGDLIALLIEVGDHHTARELAPAGLRKRVGDAAHAFTEGGGSA